MQVLHAGISTIGCSPTEVDMFDMQWLTVLTGLLHRQISTLLSTEKDVITVHVILDTH